MELWQVKIEHWYYVIAKDSTLVLEATNNTSTLLKSSSTRQETFSLLLQAHLSSQTLRIRAPNAV